MEEISFKQIAERVKGFDLPEFDLVVGIGIGGIAPASLIANKLGCELKIVTINYRDDKNRPVYPEPVLKSEFDISKEHKNVLLVDDVSRTGKTLGKAKTLLEGYSVKTLALKGEADYILFPELEDCVKWPWTN